MNKGEFRGRVRNELANVKSLIKDLLKKKIERADYTQEKQKEMLGNNTASKNDFGAFVNNLATSIEDVKTELLIAPSSDSVRRIRTILSDVKNTLGKLTSGEAKAVLDEIYQLGLLARFRQYASGDIALAKADNSKGYEARKLAFETILKFVRETSLKYLGRNMYTHTPTADELKKIIAPQIRNSIKQQQDYLDAEAVPVGKMVPHKQKPQTRADELSNYIKQSYSQLPLSRQDEINMDDWYAKFPNEEATLYALMAIMKDEHQDEWYEDIKQKLLNDPEYTAAAKQSLYQAAKSNPRLSHRVIFRTIIPTVRAQEEEERLEREDAQGLESGGEEEEYFDPEYGAVQDRYLSMSRPELVHSVTHLPGYDKDQFKSEYGKEARFMTAEELVNILTEVELGLI